KELESLRKKHQKERSGVQKSQCISIEKNVKTGKDAECMGKDVAAKELVLQQIKQWNELLDKQHAEEWDLYKSQLATESDILRKLLYNLQSLQAKHLESIFERENKDMKAKQAKISVETAKEV